MGCDSKDPPAPTQAEAPTKADTPTKAETPTKAAPAAASPTAALKRWSFDDLKPGAVPEGFELLETASTGTPATWAGVEDAAAPSGGRGFGITKTTNLGQTYNVALAPAFTAKDVELTVAIKPTTGKQDQGGGVVFRAKGARDYYVARWNPLEKNVRFYVVVGEQRSAFAAADVDLDPTRWHTMRVIVEGDRFELFMNGDSVLVTKDETLTGPGRIGLWTKADAATWFDDLTAQQL